MSVEAAIRTKLAAAFAPDHLEVVNESSNHRVPPGSESHFRVVLVTPAFEGDRLLARHRRVNAALRRARGGRVRARAAYLYAGRMAGARRFGARFARVRRSAQGAVTRVATFYRFTRVRDPKPLADAIREAACAEDLLGTVLVAAEGINGTVAGAREGVDAFVAWLRSDARFSSMRVHFAGSWRSAPAP